MTNKLQVAQTILAQLGGKMFRLMTGAKNFVGGNDFLMFSIPLSNGINKVKITLTPMDVYVMEFLYIHGRQLHGVKTVAKEEDVYFDMLRPLFERHTGLYTHL